MMIAVCKKRWPVVEEWRVEIWLSIEEAALLSIDVEEA